MALTFYQERELTRLSVKEDGAAFAGKKARAASAPSIVIGLGGLGCEALAVLKKKFRRETGGAGNVHFLAIDTDSSEICRRKEDGTFEDGESICVYEHGISEILKYNRRPEFLRKWLPDGFPECHLDDSGAQGIRQIGRVMLLCGSAYDRILHNLAAFVDSFSHYGMPPHMEVILVAGISGGTGGGSIIDVSYLVHRVMESRNITGYSFAAYILAPDVLFNNQGIRSDPVISSRLRANGYASLKEIDYFMNLENHRGLYKLDRGTDSWSCSRRIYDTCTIVPGAMGWGAVFSKEDVIGNLTDILLDSLTEIRMIGNGLLIASEFSSDRRNDLASWYSGKGSDPRSFPRSANYVYQLLGCYSVSVPVKEILAYCVSRVFREVMNEFRRTGQADGNMVKTVLSHVHLSKVNEYMNYALSFNRYDMIQTWIYYPLDSLPSKAEVRNRADNVLERARALAKREAMKVHRSSMQVELKDALIHSFESDISRIFEDKGPFFVVDLLTHSGDKTMGENDPREAFSGILEHLKHTRFELMERADACRGYTGRASFRQKLEEAADHASGLLSGRPRMMEYVEFCCRAAVQEELFPVLYEVLADVLHSVETELTDACRKIWTVYADVLIETERILEEDIRSVTDPRMHNDTCSCSIVNLYGHDEKTGKLREYLDSFASPQAVHDLCQEFIKSMRDHCTDWTADGDGFNAVGEIRAVFDDWLTGLPGADFAEEFVAAAYSPDLLTREDYVQDQLRGGTKTDRALTAAAAETAHFLKERSGRMACLDGASDRDFCSRNIISLPVDTVHLSGKVFSQNHDPAILPADSWGSIKYSVFRLVYNVPLWVIAGMQSYDWSYQESIRSIDLHISKRGDPSLKVDWQILPQPFIVDAAALRSPYYESSMDYRVLMNVKHEADDAIEKYHFLYLKNENMNCYTLRAVEETPGSRDKFAETAGAILDKHPDAEITEDLLEYCGFSFREVLLTMPEHDLVETDREGRQSDVQIGDLYKLIRMSAYYMDLLEKNLNIYCDIYSVFERLKKERQTGDASGSRQES